MNPELSPVRWQKDNRCPCCGRNYSMAQRDASGCDEWYCSDWCKVQIERGIDSSPPAHSEKPRD